MYLPKYFILSLFVAVLFSCTNLFTDEAVVPDQPKSVSLKKPETLYANGAAIQWSQSKSQSFVSYRIYYDTLPEVSPEKSMYGGRLSERKKTKTHIQNLREDTPYYMRVFVYTSSSFSGSNTITFRTLKCTCGEFTDEREKAMVRIPAGCFESKDGSLGTLAYDFYMDTTEVTSKEWFEVMHDSTVNSQKPIVAVSWYRMILFCNKKSKDANLDTCYSYSHIVRDSLDSTVTNILDLQCDFITNGYRLPTEDEWEYAYRAGQWEEYYWGKDGKTIPVEPFSTSYPKTIEDTLEICTYAWWGYNNKDSLDWYEGLKDVAKLKKNPWSLYDIAGNVFEFVWDIYSLDRPQNRTNYSGPPYGPLTGKNRIIRGGVYNFIRPFLLTAWYRNDFKSPDNNVESGVGFRTVRTILD